MLFADVAEWMPLFQSIVTTIGVMGVAWIAKRQIETTNTIKRIEKNTDGLVEKLVTSTQAAGELKGAKDERARDKTDDPKGETNGGNGIRDQIRHDPPIGFEWGRGKQ